MMNVRGAQRRPIMKEREKFRVARVERKRPRRMREKDLIRRYCWGIGVEGDEEAGDWRANKAARARGRRISAVMQMLTAEVKY